MPATFQNLPPNMARLVVRHMNGQTAARFAVASKIYSANARAHARHSANALRAAISAKVDVTARRLAGKLLMMAQHIRANTWKTRVSAPHAKYYTFDRPLGRVTMYVLNPRAIDMGAWHVNATIPVRRVGGRITLGKPAVTFGWRMRVPGMAPKRWLVTSIIRRAADMYNEAPLPA